MECPECRAAVEPAAPSFGKAAKAVLLDWRTWAVAFGCFLLAGLLAQLLGLGSSAGAGAGAAVGLFVALRLTSLRRCPACSEVFRP